MVDTTALEAEIVKACQRVAAHPDWRTARHALARMLDDLAVAERPKPVSDYLLDVLDRARREGAFPTDEPLSARDALRAIVDTSMDDMCVWCRTGYGHSPTCPVAIALVALGQPVRYPQVRL